MHNGLTDQRGSQRYASRTECEIRFVQGTKLVGGPARFVDVSIGGAQIECGFHVPLDTVFMIYLGNESPIFAQAIRHGLTNTGNYSVGAKFLEGGIPYGLFTSIAFAGEEFCMQTRGLEILCTLR